MKWQAITTSVLHYRLGSNGNIWSKERRLTRLYGSRRWDSFMEVKQAVSGRCLSPAPHLKWRQIFHLKWEIECWSRWNWGRLTVEKDLARLTVARRLWWDSVTNKRFTRCAALMNVNSFTDTNTKDFCVHFLRRICYFRQKLLCPPWRQQLCLRMVWACHWNICWGIGTKLRTENKCDKTSLKMLCGLQDFQIYCLKIFSGKSRIKKTLE